MVENLNHTIKVGSVRYGIAGLFLALIIQSVAFDL